MELPSLDSPLYPWHWNLTREQKALAMALAGLGVLARVKDGGLPFGLARGLGSHLRDRLSFRKMTGVRLGPVVLTDNDRVRHCHIVGSPGSGKTEITKTLVFEDIRRGRGCFLIDAKGDRELYEEVQGFCRFVGREKDLHLLSATYPDESCIWNPCGLGNVSELQSKFLNANIYSEPFYAKACEYGLLQAFESLAEMKPKGFNLQDLVRELERLAGKQKGDVLQGLFYDFGSLAQGEWANVLGCGSSPANRPEISLLDIVQRNQILFVDLPTEGKSVQSSRIGRLLTQELILLSGMRKAYPGLNRSGVFSVFIDEFDAFATESFISFLNKGRSSRFMIHIIHQTLSDLKRISAEFAGQTLGLCNVHLICRQDDPDDAEFWARFIGTQTTIKRTYQTQDGSRTGMASTRETQEFLISPDEIKSLGVGECVLSIKTQKLSRKAKLPLPPRYSNPESPENPFPTQSKVRSIGRSEVLREPLNPEALGLHPIEAPAESPTQEKWQKLLQSNPPPEVRK